MASRKQPRPVTLNFFPLGDDLPLFSGSLPRPRRTALSWPTRSPGSPVLIDLRLDPFHTLDSAAQADPARLQ